MFKNSKIANSFQLVIRNNFQLSMKIPRQCIGIKRQSRRTKIHRESLIKTDQSVQTLIRLLPEEQSDQRLHCLPFRLCLLNAYRVKHVGLLFDKFQSSNFTSTVTSY